MVKQIAQGIFLEAMPTMSRYAQDSNVFIVCGEERNLIIDCAYDAEYYRNSLTNLMAELKIDPGKTDVFITHNHLDHSGSAFWCSKQGMRVLMNPQEDELQNLFFNNIGNLEKLADECHYLGLDIDILKQFNEVYEQLFAERTIAIPHKFEYTPIYPGEFLDVGFYNFEIVPLHGHTIAQQGLFDKRSRILFAADQVLSSNVPLVPGYLPDTDNVGEYLANIQYLLDLQPKCILPGHGDVITRVNERLNALLQHYDKRERQIFALLSGYKGEFSTYELAQVMYHLDKTAILEKDSYLFIMICTKLFACLEYLYSNGKVKRKIKNGVCYYAL